MPHFFNEIELTDDQKARWDDAIIRYKQVQDDNLDRKISKLTQQDRNYYAEKWGAKTDAEIRLKMRAFSNLTSNSPGHPKSALFARLLNGQEPLPFPPPTNHSYPWYSVIEDDGPHHAALGGVYTAGSMFRVTRGATEESTISINQCMWAVKSLNSAAQLLLDLNEELRGLARKENPDDENSSLIYEWTDDLLARVKAAYTQSPEFIVQHSEWPEFRLFVTQLDSYCHNSQKKYARDKIFNTIKHLKRTGSVFDLESLDINARIGKTLRQGEHPKIRLDEAKARYATLVEQGQSNGIIAMFDKVAADRMIANLEADVRDFEVNPDNEDWVELFLDMWYLEKLNK